MGRNYYVAFQWSNGAIEFVEIELPKDVKVNAQTIKQHLLMLTQHDKTVGTHEYNCIEAGDIISWSLIEKEE